MAVIALKQDIGKALKEVPEAEANYLGFYAFIPPSIIGIIIFDEVGTS